VALLRPAVALRRPCCGPAETLLWPDCGPAVALLWPCLLMAVLRCCIQSMEAIALTYEKCGLALPPARPSKTERLRKEYERKRALLDGDTSRSSSP
jgi:hypothetical protein